MPEVRLAGEDMIDHLRLAMQANAMGYALRMARLRQEAAARRAQIQRQLDDAMARQEHYAGQMACGRRI